MRRQFQSIPLHASGTAAVALLAALLTGTRQVSALDLARVLVQAALNRVGLYTSTLWSLTVGPEATRRCLRNNFERQNLRALGFDRLLQSVTLPRGLRRSPRIVTIDSHERPYYGRRQTKGIRGGQTQASTRYFWTYATLTVMHHGRSLTLAVVPMPKGTTPKDVVTQLLDRLNESGLKIKVLLMDRGFYAADLIGELQRRRVSFLLPVIRRGTATTGTQSFFRPGPSRYTTYTWQPRYRRGRCLLRGDKLTMVIAIVPRPKAEKVAKVEKVEKVEKGPLVFATDAKRRSLSTLAALYQKRFAIETTYRLLHQVEAKTTSKDPHWRRLLILIGFLLINLWVLSQTATPADHSDDEPTADLTWRWFLHRSFSQLALDWQIAKKPEKEGQSL